ncbi:MAG: hypothetical protein QM529_04915 [Hydrotalea sp.]|nr:hypothetical protein [Hydrotalea sp.]
MKNIKLIYNILYKLILSPFIEIAALSVAIFDVIFSNEKSIILRGLITPLRFLSPLGLFLINVFKKITSSFFS